jgi:hypothetical protein
VAIPGHVTINRYQPEGLPEHRARPPLGHLAGSRVDSVQRKSKLERYGGRIPLLSSAKDSALFTLFSRNLWRVQAANGHHVINKQYFECYHLPAKSIARPMLPIPNGRVAKGTGQRCAGGKMACPVLGFTW